VLDSTVNVNPVTSMSPVKFVQRNVGDGFLEAEQLRTVPAGTVDPSVTAGVIITLRGQSADRCTSLDDDYRTCMHYAVKVMSV